MNDQDITLLYDRVGRVEIKIAEFCKDQKLSELPLSDFALVLTTIALCISPLRTLEKNLRFALSFFTEIRIVSPIKAYLRLFPPITFKH